VNGLRLYEQYDRRQALAPFGDELRAEKLCDGQWLVFFDAVVCLTAVGEPPGASHFASGSRFRWVADQPYRVHEGQYNHFVPPQVIGPAGKARPIHLFVRPDRSAAYRYVGRLEPSYMQQAPGSGNHGMAEFELRPTLPSDVWSELGGLRRAGAVDGVAVDRALDRLRGPTAVEDRLDVLRELVEYWHGPIRPSDGFAEAELASSKLPSTLKWWYGWAGRRKEIMSGQNFLLAPTDPVHPYWQLKTEDDRLLFYLANQGVYRWATLPEGDDPPVFGRYEASDPWEPEGVTLSEH
jgi:hypothetical protein